MQNLNIKSVLHNGQKSRYAIFETPEEYADFISSIPGYNYYGYRELQKRERELNCLRIGDITLAEKAEKFMEQLRVEGIMSVGLPMPSRAVTGAMTILPLYEAGIPNCMVTRRTSDVRGISTPINIYWDRFRSGAIGHGDAIINRGIAITAFAMAMSTIRPVNLYMISVSCPHNAYPGMRGCYGGLVRMETRPLDLARAVDIYTSSAFSGTLTFNAMAHMFQQENNYAADWACGPLWLRHSPSNPQYSAELRAIFDIGENDVLIYGMHAHDTLSWTDPVAWVRKMLDDHVGKQE